MGNNVSEPVLDESETELAIQNEGLEFLPNNIPPDHPLKSILAAHNKLQLIPTVLLHLENLDISFNELDKIEIKCELDYPELKNLSISGNLLKQFPVNLSKYTKLTDLVADRNMLQDDPQNPYENLQNLENVDLTLNSYINIPIFAPSLISLNLNFNQIEKLTPLNLPNLRELRLAGNEIKEISPECSFPQLKTLDLSMNIFKEFPKLANFAPTLEIINLSFNVLTSFPEDIPESITKIDVSHNKISVFETSLEKNINLTTLDISFNEIKNLPLLPENLETFNCENNQIEYNGDVVIKMLKLQTFQCSYNNISQIPKLQNCKANTLILTHNKLEAINTENLGTLITRLDFTSNIIKEIPESVFQIDKLQTLNLTNNCLTKVPDNIKCSSITSLYISQNDISSLPLQLPVSLITIEAIGCKFTEFPDQLTELNRLSYIDFSNNQISEIKRFPPTCRHIGLSCNNLQTIPDIPDSVTFLDLSHNKMKELKIKGDFMMIQELDISHNNLDVFKFENLQICHTMKLSHNPLSHFSLDYSKLPSLKYLDIVNTKIKTPSKLPDSIKDMSTSDLKFFQSTKSPRVKYFNPTKSGYSSTIGVRPTMEDSIIIREDFETMGSIYAVIDGHGGSDTANIAAYMIPQYLQQEKSVSIVSFVNVINRLQDRLKRSNVKDGATIAFVIVAPKQIKVAYLGDTRAIIVNKDRSINQLTFDHKATNTMEINYIKKNRSFVSDKRTAGILAISRAIGDLNIEGVIHETDVNIYNREPTDYRLVIACDGIYDVLSQEEVGNIVCDIPDVNVAATTLKNIALARLTQDNISVIVVDIEN